MKSAIPIKIIVKNDNVSNQGSGVIISLINEKYDMVLTCAHCIEGVEELDDIRLKCDDYKDSKLEIVDYYPKEFPLDYLNDSNVLDVGIIIIKKIPFGMKSYIRIQESEITENLFILGYPHVLKFENSLKAIKLKCKFQNESINENDIVVELEKSISETAATSEKESVDGFSGAPVYYAEEGHDTLVGLAKRVPITENDSVTFDRVIILNIKNALDYLKEKGWIIYNVDIKSNKLYVKWIEDKNFNDYIDKKILVIGGSGAGKSSFINTFSKNRMLIDSSGDGQTTRTNIEYKFSLFESKPRVQIEFLKKRKFIDNRIETVKIELLEFAFSLLKKEVYNLKQEIDIVIKKSMKELKSIVEDDQYDKQFRDSVSKFINDWDDINDRNARTKREDIISLNLELLNILQKKDVGFNFSKIVTKNNKDKLKKILLMKKSFFDYREFDFIKIDGSVISNKIESLFSDEFLDFTISDLNFNENNNKIEKLYGNIYELLIKEIKEIYEISGHNCDIIFDSLNANKEKIARALKVVDGESITALVDKVEIYDNFSNDYALIMDRLKLKELILIDTCGLDHIETGEVPEKIITDLFTNYNFDIKTVFYLKKLDSGKPTELEKIIPTIYSVHSNAVVYCVSSGIDIFYKDLENPIIDWCSEETKKSIPKSVNYLFNEGKIDILEVLEKTKGKGVRIARKNTIYSTLIKNLVPFCSITNREEAEKFYENNVYHIEKLFKSIVLEEHLGLEVIPSSIFEGMKSNIKYQKHVKYFLKDLFKEASITDWTISNYGHGHYKTKEKNISEITTGILGFWGTYNDYWNYAFNKAYNELVSYETVEDTSFDELLKVTIEEFESDNIIERIESVIIDFKDTFLGCKKYDSSVFKIQNSICEDCELECFRKILISMYDTNEYKYSLVEKPVNIAEHTWLNEICNFEKGFHIIEDEISNYFIKKLIEKLETENIKKFDTVIEINPEIKSSYEKFLVEIAKGFLYKDSIQDLSADVFEYLSKLN